MPHEDRSKDFELLELKGEGSFGEVYSAKRKSDGLIVAVKKIEVENNVVSNSLEREIEILQNCDHENVVKYYASFRHKHYMWIVMEYCEVGSIRDILDISEKTLSENQIAYVASQILRSLVYLHGKGIIHRDLKAGNILLNGEGDVKVADFGVSGKISNPHSKRLTVIGTPLWMAPEIIKGIPYSTSADIWSLGITIIEMADGYPPFADEHPMKAMFKIPFNPPPKVEEPGRFSEHFNDFVSKCLIKEADLRPSAKELLNHPFIVSGLQQKEKVKKLVDAFKKLSKEKDEDEEDEDEKNSEYSFSIDDSVDYSTTVMHDDKENEQNTIKTINKVNRNKTKKKGTIVKKDDDFSSDDEFNDDIIDEDDEDGDGFSTIIQHNKTPEKLKLPNSKNKNEEGDEDDDEDDADYSATIVKHDTIDSNEAKDKHKYYEEKEEENDTDAYSTVIMHKSGNYYDYLNTGDFSTIVRHPTPDEKQIEEAKKVLVQTDSNSEITPEDSEEGYPIVANKSKIRNNSMRIALRNSFSFPRKSAKQYFSTVNKSKITTINRGVQVDYPHDRPVRRSLLDWKYPIIFTLFLYFSVTIGMKMLK